MGLRNFLENDCRRPVRRPSLIASRRPRNAGFGLSATTRAAARRMYYYNQRTPAAGEVGVVVRCAAARGMVFGIRAGATSGRKASRDIGRQSAPPRLSDSIHGIRASLSRQLPSPCFSMHEQHRQSPRSDPTQWSSEACSRLQTTDEVAAA